MGKAAERLTAIVKVYAEVRWHMTRHPDLHSSLSKPIELNLEPVELERSWVVCMISASVHHCAVSNRYNRDLGV